MNKDIREAAGAAKRTLQQWETFVRAHCTKQGLSYETVIKDNVVIELLNVQWLRTVERHAEQAPPLKTE